MSIDTPDSTVTSLKELIGVRLDALELLLTERFKTVETKLNYVTEEALNLRKEQSDLVHKGDCKYITEKFANDIGSLKDFRSVIQGKQSILTVVVATVVSIAIGFVNYLFRKV